MSLWPKDPALVINTTHDTKVKGSVPIGKNMQQAVSKSQKTPTNLTEVESQCVSTKKIY